MPLTNYAFADLITFTRSTTATFVGSNGLIQSAAINAPRFDFDPVTLAPLGFLIEEQRVNLLLYSAEFDNAAWAKTNTTITANATTSPDGTANADGTLEVDAAELDRLAEGTHRKGLALPIRRWQGAASPDLGAHVFTARDRRVAGRSGFHRDRTVW